MTKVCHSRIGALILRMPCLQSPFIVSWMPLSFSRNLGMTWHDHDHINVYTYLIVFSTHGGRGLNICIIYTFFSMFYIIVKAIQRRKMYTLGPMQNMAAPDSTYTTKIVQVSRMWKNTPKHILTGKFIVFFFFLGIRAI